MTLVFSFLFMQKFSSKVALFFLIFSLLAFSGCAVEEKTQVRNYNNVIVDLQQKMLKRNQDTAALLSLNDSLDADKALVEMQKVYADVEKTVKDFRAVKVPKGAENLAGAMQNFFDVEIAGVGNVVATLKELQKSKQKTTAFNELMKNSDDFMKKENDALMNFDKVKKETATHYNEKIQEAAVDNDSALTTTK